MTILGIVLSMALFTAVILGAYSGIVYFRKVEIAQSGKFEAYYFDLSEDQLNLAKKEEHLLDFAAWQEVGWAEIDSYSESKHHLIVQSVDDRFEELVAVNFVEGRMPETEDEIALPYHLTGYVDQMYEVGDTVELNLQEAWNKGKRIGFTANELGEETEDSLRFIRKKSYTVVGIYHKLSPYIEEYDCPGYIALTKGGGNGAHSLFFTLKEPQHFYKFSETQKISDRIRTHGILLKMYGSFQDNPLSQLLYSFAFVLVSIIFFGSVTLIYNSFSISVNERTRQFGILKSIGATKKQIRHSVILEALILSVIAIPIGILVGCIGIGTTFWGLQDAFQALTKASPAATGNHDASISLVIHPIGIGIASAVCLSAALVSAYIPALRAMKLQPIEAIRQVRDIRINPKKIKVSRLTRKLFGFEGMMAAKNFKRNKKSYRATVLSLFLSIVLFVSSTFFSNSLSDSIHVIASNENASDLILDIPMYSRYSRAYGEVHSDFDEEAFRSEISAADSVTEVVPVFFIKTEEILVQPEFCSDEFKQIRKEISEMLETSEAAKNSGASKNSGAAHESKNLRQEPIETYISIAFVADRDFRSICEINGISPDRFFRTDTPKGFIYNQKTIYTRDMKIRKTDFLNPDKLPAVLQLRTYKQIEGYSRWGKKDGRITYYPNAVLHQYLNSRNEKNDLNPEDAISFSHEEVERFTPLPIDTAIDHLPPTFFRGDLMILYPESMFSAVIAPEILPTVELSYHYYIRSSDYPVSHKAIREILKQYKLPQNALYNLAESRKAILMLVQIINVFALGFVIVISLIAAANVFNTISTNVLLRRREFANLKSIGLSQKSFKKMMVYECIIYGIKGLLWGVPTSIASTVLIHRATSNMIIHPYKLPLPQLAISFVSVLLVVFSTMIYAAKKIEKDPLIEAMKNEAI